MKIQQKEGSIHRQKIKELWFRKIMKAGTEKWLNC